MTMEDILNEIIAVEEILVNIKGLADELEISGDDPETLDWYRNVSIPYYEARLIEFIGYRDAYEEN